jgi:hypothetical protein
MDEIKKQQLASFSPENKALELKKAELDKQISETEGQIANNPAAISKMMALRSARDALAQQQKAVQGPATSQESQQTTPYAKIGKSNFFKGPEKEVTVATQGETEAAAPYSAIGESGHFKGPQPEVEAEPAPAAIAVPPIAGAGIEKDKIATAEPPAVEPAQAIADKKADLPPLPNGMDWGKLAKNLGVGLAELVNAFALGEAGVTDPNQLATYKRLGREQEAAQLQAQKDQAQKELDFAAKKDELNRAYEAAQAKIQNDFILTRDQAQAEASMSQLQQEHQNKLSEINAEYQKQARSGAAEKMPEWVQRVIQAGPPAKAGKK